MPTATYICPDCTQPLQPRRDPRTTTGASLECRSRNCDYPGWAVTKRRR